MACRFDRNCSNIAAGKFWAARLACFFRNLKVSPVIGFCPLASPQIWTAVSISAPCSRGHHCIFPPAHIPQPPSTPAPHEFHRCWFAAKPNRVNDITIPREKLVIRQAVLHAPCLGRQGRRPVEYHQACVDASRGDVRAAIGKDGNGLVFGHKKPPAGDRGGRALVRPGLLPIGRIPFREPPCAGTQVGEGIALLLMQFTDYRSFFWPSSRASSGRRAFSGPSRILGVLYRESFFAGEGMILEVEQDQSPYDTGHRAISPPRGRDYAAP